MIGVIDYYQRPPGDYRNNIIPGIITTAPVLFTLNKTPIRVRVDAYDTGNPSNSTFTLVKTDINNYDPTREQSLRYWGLNSDDYLLAVGCKNRPVVVLSEPITQKAHDIIGYTGFVVAPLYSIFDASGDYKNHITREIVMRVQAYQVKNLFYLPSSEEFGIGESFIRLDRIQFVRVDQFIPRPVSLTGRALDILRQWSWNYLGISAILDPAVEAFIKLASTKINT